MRSSLKMGPRLTVCAVLLCAVFLVANSAPTSSKPSNDAIKTLAKLTSQPDPSRNEKPLARTKRAEEILYGNHQNAPRVKKSDPAAAALETAPAEEGQAKAADAVKTDANAFLPEENDSRAEEAEEHLFPVENQDEEQEEEEEEGDDQNSFEGIPVESEETDFPRYEGQEQQQQQEAVRRKRNAKIAALMTAENMVAGGGGGVAFVANRPIRAKRDLDYEELRELFENSRKAPYEVEDDEEEDFRPVAIVPVLPEVDRQNEDEGVGDEGEELAEEEEEEMSKREDVPLAVAIPYSYEPRYDAASSDDKMELIRELVKQKAEEDAKEKLIDYLLAAAIASSEAESEDDGNGDDGIGGEGEVAADGRLVIEAPVRPDYDDDDGGEEEDDDREAAAAVKRNVFYPYSYEPYGGRWGAMVPGAKRSEDGYERLYRLAEALNADNDDADDYEEK